MAERGVGLRCANPTYAASVPVSPLTCPSSWRLVRLKDIAKKIGSDATPAGGQAAYQETRTNYALVRSQNVFDRAFSDAGLAFISDEQAEGLRNARLQKNDLLLNITGDGVTFGRACLVPDEALPACVNQHVSIIRLDPSLAYAIGRRTRTIDRVRGHHRVQILVKMVYPCALLDVRF